MVRLTDRPDMTLDVYRGGKTTTTTTMMIHLFRSVSLVTHKLISLNKTCMAAILKALSTVMNENRRNKVFTVIKQQKMREYSKDTYFSLFYYIHVIFISMFPQSLTSCILSIVDRHLT